MGEVLLKYKKFRKALSLEIPITLSTSFIPFAVRSFVDMAKIKTDKEISKERTI